MQTYQHLIMTQSIIVVRERTSSMLHIGYVDSKESEKCTSSTNHDLATDYMCTLLSTQAPFQKSSRHF